MEEMYSKKQNTRYFGNNETLLPIIICSLRRERKEKEKIFVCKAEIKIQVLC